MSEQFVYAKKKKGNQEVLKMRKDHYDKYADELTEVKDGATEYAKQEQAKAERAAALKAKQDETKKQSA